MADLVLVRTRNNPAPGVKKNSDSGAYSGRRMPPYGIMYIAAYCRSMGHTVKLFDLFRPEFDDLSVDEISDLMIAESPMIVGISSMTNQSVQAMELGDALMQKSETIVIHGGVHPATLPQQALQHGHYVVKGDGEQTMHDILTHLKETGSMPPTRQGDVDLLNQDDISGRIYEGHLMTVEQLDAIPWFTREQFDETAFDFSLSPYFPVMTARGCPYRCVFCKDGFGLRQSKVRYHSVDYVVDYFEYLQKTFNARKLIILDDIFLSSKERMEEMATKMENRNVRFKIQCQVHPNVVKSQYLKLMHRLGIDWVYIGIESGNDEIQKFINKSTNVKKITKAVHMLKKNGFYTAGMFMIGNIGETQETIEDSIRFASKLPLDRTWWSFAAPYPGTPFYEMVDEYGEILEPDFAKWNQNSLVYKPKDVSVKQMRELMGRAQRVRIAKKIRHTLIGAWEAPLRRMVNG